MSLNIVVSADVAAAGKQIEDFSKKSRTALTSLSLVAQDLPFGFIGIQNNLPGVISSFGELTREAGGVGGALKQLGSSLIGPAGLFLAFSAVTAGVTYAIQQYGSLGKAIDVLVFSGKALSKEQQEIAKNIANEGTQALTLYSLYTNLNDSREKQVDIVKKLNQISPEYFGNLDAEKTKIDELKGSIDRYIDSFIGKIYVETQQKKITELITKYAEKISFVIDKELELDKQREKSANKNKNFIRDIELLAKTQQKAGDISVGIPTVEIKKTTQEVIDGLRAQLRASVEDVFKGVGKFKQFIDIGEIFGDKGKGKTPKAVEETAKSTLQTVENLRKQIDDILIPKKLDKTAGAFVNKNPLIEYQFGQITAIINALKEEAKFIDDAFRAPLENLFIDFLQKGKLSFEDFTKSVVKNIGQIVAKLAASKIFEALANLIPQIAGTLLPGGTELLQVAKFLGTGRSIFKGANLGGIDGGGMNLNGQVVFVQRGTDLVGVMNRTNSQISRIG